MSKWYKIMGKKSKHVLAFDVLSVNPWEFRVIFGVSERVLERFQGVSGNFRGFLEFLKEFNGVRGLSGEF